MAPPATQPDSATAPSRVCLVVIFNHRFEANLPKLDGIYGSRFRHVRYLMPFYRGSRTDVYPVFYSSYQFQGYLLEAWRRLREEGFTHFVFVADDILLNPRLHEGNICAELGLEAARGSAYLGSAAPIGTVTGRWPYLMRALVAVAGQNGVNWAQELPTYEEARATLAARGFAHRRFGWRTVLCRMTLRSFFLLLFYVALVIKRRKTQPTLTLTDPPYPLLVAYSDFFIVPAEAMDRFCELCGVFAAMGVFVEAALPTALALSAPLVHESDTAWKAHEDMQHPSQWEAFGQRHHFELKEVIAGMGERELFIHPIKLSRWKL